MHFISLGSLGPEKVLVDEETTVFDLPSVEIVVVVLVHSFGMAPPFLVPAQVLSFYWEQLGCPSQNLHTFYKPRLHVYQMYKIYTKLLSYSNVSSVPFHHIMCISYYLPVTCLWVAVSMTYLALPF